MEYETIKKLAALGFVILVVLVFLDYRFAVGFAVFTGLAFVANVIWGDNPKLGSSVERLERDP